MWHENDNVFKRIVGSRARLHVVNGRENKDRYVAFQMTGGEFVGVPKLRYIIPPVTPALSFYV